MSFITYLAANYWRASGLDIHEEEQREKLTEAEKIGAKIATIFFLRRVEGQVREREFTFSCFFFVLQPKMLLTEISAAPDQCGVNLACGGGGRLYLSIVGLKFCGKPE